MNYPTHLVALGIVLGIAGGAHGQTVEQRGLRPVTQMSDDKDPLAGSLGHLEGGLGVSAGQSTFVYKGASSTGDGQDKFYFISPGVVAEYDRSQYGMFQVSKHVYRIYNLVPPNTVFHIGLPPEQAPAVSIPAPLSVDRRVVARVDASVNAEWKTTADDATVESGDRRMWRRYLAYSQQNQQVVLKALGELE